MTKNIVFVADYARRREKTDKKTVSALMFMLLSIGIVTLAFNIQPAKGWAGTACIRADGSIEPSDAPIITYDNVIYTLTGNITSSADGIVVERDNIVIDGNGFTLQGTGVYLSNGIVLSGRTNVTIMNTRIKIFWYGIGLYGSSNNSVNGNDITAKHWCGVYLYGSSNYNSISGNDITANNDYGIYLSGSSNSIVGNSVANNGDGIVLFSWSNYNNSVGGNNITANNGDGIRLAGSSNNNISGNDITANNGDGILVDNSNYNSISGNNITSNGGGMWLLDSSNYNSISRNNITANNNVGISLYESSNNIIYHNNFMDNSWQVYDWAWGLPPLSPSINVWDDGYPSGGNYWSDYVGVDVKNGPNQDLLGSDGIGDTPYTIDENNQDRYPLMEPWTSMPTTYTFPIVWGEETFIVSVESNSTVSNFLFNQPNKEVSFNVYGPVDAIGFCIVTIPNQLLDGPWTVLIDAQLPLYFTPLENGTHSILYFTYSHSTHQIQIIGTWVIGDTTPPLIDTLSQEPESDKVTPDTAVTVYVNVTDIESGVKSVILSYKMNSVATWNLTMLYNATTALYQATIPAFPSGTSICYKIIAYDDADNVAINDNAGLYYCYTVSAPVPPLPASISPLSASMLVGQSVTFTSTVSGGVIPYSYQWNLNGALVSGATSETWTFAPTASGIYYVYLKVTDDVGNTTQSETARIEASAVPVGGYSVPIQLPTTAKPATYYIALTAILTAVLVKVRRKKRKR